MNIHEYQAKELLRAFGLSVPKGGVAYTVGEAVKVAEELGGKRWVVKAQIHAGGRGKGGGIKLVKSIQEVKTQASKLLGMQLITEQTGAEGKEVERIYIEECCDIAREYYLGILVDRVTSRITIIASLEGGMEIEEVAARSPEKIFKVSVDPAYGIQEFHARKIAHGLGLQGLQVKSAVVFIRAMYTAFEELDASIVEINPMAVTGKGEVIAVDAKMSIDDNALFRQKHVAKLRDESEENPTELEATKYDLNYVKLEGNIGCMVNGAGLAMATMDIIKLYGGQPANFLDVGGGASRERVTAAFKLILSDPNVEGLLINIFGGIMRCDVIAEGVVAAAREVSLIVPLVVRLAGTNVVLGKQILEDSSLPIIAADDLANAAKKIVKAVDEAA
ncbi:MAG: ADP-forming succinate--CoA ligase subunit beta [Pseudomonadota bacterium]|nr:ADP-forming succinate--CoA ligase subunit beta [Pseudomonadota bacterium]